MKPQIDVSWMAGDTLKDTAEKCASVVRFMGSAFCEAERASFTEDEAHGAFIILQTVADVLTAAAEREAGNA
ncbi:MULTISPECIES: hypothetical protein [Hydrocarboniphaga]|uniref:hypothetical protein n=1 Tax=Hydrocarboniphaga TaxID=243627 RepID=UPI0005914DB9|nr:MULTISPECIES: hypothetical protein [Hydrocarboniphaga]MDZ4077193.1 hypothetical protein [Hydrocarboniphaga sp.]